MKKPRKLKKVLNFCLCDCGKQAIARVSSGFACARCIELENRSKNMEDGKHSYIEVKKRK